MLISCQVIPLKFVDEVALVVGEFVSVDEVTLPEGADHVHDVSLSREEVYAFIVEVEAINTLAKALGILAARFEEGEEPGREVIAVKILILLSALKLKLNLGEHAGALLVSITVFGMIRGGRSYFCRLDVFVRGIEALKLLSLLSEGLVATNTTAHNGPN